MSLLENRVAVVTGGSSGIGRAICERFASAGAAVVNADLREGPREEGPAVHRYVRETYDVQAAFVKADVTDKTALERAGEVAMDLGGLDVWVNNAGILWAEEFTSVTEEAFDQLVDVNVKGTFFGTQAAVERMLKDDGGSIVNMSRTAGIEGSGHFATYSLSKGAVKLLTYSVADRYGPDGIRVNAIHPGTTETSMMTEDLPFGDEDRKQEHLSRVPLRRFGNPSDIADTALYLASDLSDFVTGESILVDGGITNTR